MNSGRAVIRNVLASEARYPWLLFIDSDMTVCRTDFIERYISTVGDVVYGGLVIRHTTRQNLRARYELSRASEHTLERRRQSPYHDFHTANFMIRRDLMLTHPFDERFSRYGYEDVLLGKTLQMNAIGIEHIDNPLSFEIFESNAAFVSKTEEGLQTLYSFRHELRGYSRMIDFTEQHPVVSVLIRCWHHIAKKWERRHLCSNAPTLCVFTLYRLGYFLSLKR
jgi:glycosyltransferase involved in cell wall biosynthesis